MGIHHPCKTEVANKHPDNDSDKPLIKIAPERKTEHLYSDRSKHPHKPHSGLTTERCGSDKDQTALTPDSDNDQRQLRVVPDAS